MKVPGCRRRNDQPVLIRRVSVIAVHWIRRGKVKMRVRARIPILLADRWEGSCALQGALYNGVHRLRAVAVLNQSKIDDRDLLAARRESVFVDRLSMIDLVCIGEVHERPGRRQDQRLDDALRRLGLRLRCGAK